MKPLLSLFQRILLPALLLAVPTLHAQEPARIDPKHPDWQWFPIVDTMRGIVANPKPNVSEQFGYKMHAIGDVDNSGTADFVVNHVRADTLFTRYTNSPNKTAPNELLLYKGVKGKIPASANGERIGLTELGASVRFLASGDFDGNNWLDLVVLAQIYADTSFGNTNNDYDIYSIIVFWNDGQGHYSLTDTTRLQVASVDSWYASEAVSNDWENDRADDLLVWSRIDGYKQGQGSVKIPRMILYRGQSGQQWGRNGVPATPDWSWWNPPPFNSMSDYAIDQDGDGAADVAFYLSSASSVESARVSVLYGKPGGGLPDTLDLESITLETANGKNALFSDVTGDRMPELLLDCGFQETVKIYAGRRGQRLKEQYGSGEDDPITGQGWWHKPWAELWHAHRINDGWTGSGYGGFMDLGDGNLDGINDIWLPSSPYILCYVTGTVLDSLIDGIIQMPSGQWAGDRALLGDIMGSGIPIIAISNSGVGGIAFFKATRDLPETGVYRKLPHVPADVGNQGETMSTRDAETLELQAVPNPARSEVTIQWKCKAPAGKAVIAIHDILGRGLTQWSVPTAQGQALWKTETLVGGAYFVTVTIGKQSATIRVVVQ